MTLNDQVLYFEILDFQTKYWSSYCIQMVFFQHEPILSWQFMDTMRSHATSNVVWVDFTKMGRLSNSDMNMCIDLAASILQKKPQTSVAIVVCPVLISERIKNNIRGEIRTE